MKKAAMELAAICLLLLLTACGQNETMDTDWTVRQMAEAISASQVLPVETTVILPQDDLYETYLTMNYELARDAVSDGAIFAAGGTSAQEIAVFRIAEGVSAADTVETLQQYLENRAGAFTGYLPDEAALLENSQVAVRGNYVALLACTDIPAAKAAFDACFTEEPPDEMPPVSQQLSHPGEPKEPEAAQNGLDEPQQINDGSPALEQPKSSPEAQTEDMPGAEQENAEELPPSQIEAPHKTQEEEAAAMKPKNEGESFSAGQTLPWSYSRVRLLDAWAAGNWSGLAEEDQAILNACAQIIRSEAPEGLSDYEKELAIHDWMIAWGSYDSNRLNPLLGPQENPNNDNPYGFLADRKGICLGYSSTFQLFMDLLGIECITVNGTSRNHTTDHAWNQVRLDGEWYCVDVTWDDPTTSASVSEQTAHRYFNVTSEHMRATDHQWDDSSVPEAAGRTYVWNSEKEDAAVEDHDFSLLTSVEITGVDLSDFDREQREVLYQQARYCQAMTEADVDTLREMIADDTVFTHMSGKQQSREEYLADIENGSLRYFSIGMDNPVVEVDSDLASVTFTSVLNANAYGARGTYRISGTHWYERQNGVWIAVNDPN